MFQTKKRFIVVQYDLDNNRIINRNSINSIKLFNKNFQKLFIFTKRLLSF